MKKTAVVILNWNGKKLLEKFLPDIIRFSSHIADIIIADNNSTDDSVIFVSSTFSDIQIIQLEKNYGFAEGYNIALSKLRHEYCILLNSDIEVTEKWIEPLIDLMDKGTNVAAVQPKIKAYNNKSSFEYAGAAGGYIDRYGFPFCRGRVFDHLEEDIGQYNDRAEVFWASGACMIIRMTAFNKAGGFDSDFFAHMEEIDLCWRMKLLGYRILYTPDSEVYHIGGGTLSKGNALKTYLNFRNNLLMLFKNIPAHDLFPVLFIRLMMDGLAGFFFLLNGNFSGFFNVLKSHYAFYLSIPGLTGKRKQINRLNGMFYPGGILRGNVVFEYFIRGHKRFTDLTGRLR